MLNDKVIEFLKDIWDYMVLNMELKKCDIIIGNGCSSLDIPVRCSELLKKNYGKLILFTGGLGKITNEIFNKSEAEIYRDIAIAHGVDKDRILIENKSTNTGDNFRFSIKLLKTKNINVDKILIVHSKLSERRTLNCAKAIIKNKKLIITSPNITFDEYINKLNSKSEIEIYNILSVIAGDIQRLIIFPQFGWQIEQYVPQHIINIYFELKDMGYSKYILSRDDIQKLVDKYSILKEKEINFFN